MKEELAMETLEINFKSVFETLPGKHALLLPDGPTFTIAAISDAYVSSLGLTREQSEGHSVFRLLSTGLNPDAEASFGRIKESLERVIRSRKPHQTRILLSLSARQTGTTDQLNHMPVLSADGDVTYIIQTVTSGGPGNGGPPLKRNGVVSKIGIDFYDLIMQAPVAIGVLRGESMILEMANTPMLQLWGKTTDIIGLPITRGIPEINDQAFPELLERVFQTGVAYYGVETPAFLYKDGKKSNHYFNFVYSPVRENGVTTCIMMVATDVTSIVESKKKLEESEKRYRDLIASATVATAVYQGEDHKIFLANESMLKLWGKDSSVVGKPLKEALPELAGQPFLDLLDRVYKTGATYHSAGDRADLHIDGRLESFYFHFTYKALRDSEGKIYGILNMAVDVSDTVNANIRISEAEERWRIALDSAELGTWDYYPVTGKFFCSARTKELFGLSPDAEASFEKMLAAIHDGDRERVRAEIGQAFAQPKARDLPGRVPGDGNRG